MTLIIKDQLNRTIEIPSSPKRIISLVPSQSELLWDLGLRAELTGITKFCIHPVEMFRTKTRVGGTKKINIEKIKQLKPHLIIANKEENEEVQVKELMRYFPVWISDIKTLDDAFAMINSLGEITGKSREAGMLIKRIKKNFSLLPVPRSRPKTIYVIWKNPYMAAGKNTFIGHLMERCGFENIFDTVSSRYPEFSMEEIKKMQPGLILLSSEPYPFKEKHLQEFRGACPLAKVMRVDGELFSWYGSRLVHAPAYFTGLLARLD